MSKFTCQLKTWTGTFGKKYTDRNIFTVKELDTLYLKQYGATRTTMNREFLGRLFRSSRILEIGSNVGNQLVCLQKMGFTNLYGIEPQAYAVECSKSRTKNINIIQSSAFDIPFKDKYFDLIFTSGLLIHIAPSDINTVIREIHRCSKKYIWGFEYYANEYTEIIHRGKKSMLWKADFPKIYTDTFSDLETVKVKPLKYLNNDNVNVMFLLKKKNA